MLDVKNVSVKINEKTIVDDVSFVLEDNEILMVIGPNGAGKTTLVRAIMQSVKHDGEIQLFGKTISEFSKKDIAKKIGVLTQEHVQQFSFDVEEVVSLGRYVYQEGFLGKLGKHDKEMIDEAMDITGTYWSGLIFITICFIAASLIVVPLRETGRANNDSF